MSPEGIGASSLHSRCDRAGVPAGPWFSPGGTPVHCPLCWHERHGCSGTLPRHLRTLSSVRTDLCRPSALGDGSPHAPPPPPSPCSHAPTNARQSNALSAIHGSPSLSARRFPVCRYQRPSHSSQHDPPPAAAANRGRHALCLRCFSVLKLPRLWRLMWSVLPVSTFSDHTHSPTGQVHLWVCGGEDSVMNSYAQPSVLPDQVALPRFSLSYTDPHLTAGGELSRAELGWKWSTSLSSASPCLLWSPPL